MGIEPKVVSESEPISELTKITQPVGTKNVAGTQINPATEDTLAKIDEIGLVVAHASTTTALGINGSWTSPTESSLITGLLIGSVFADQAGTLYIEQSPNNTNWGVVDSYAISANAGIGFSIEKIAEHIRARYVNGGVAQTVFRLYVYRRLRVR